MKKKKDDENQPPTCPEAGKWEADFCILAQKCQIGEKNCQMIEKQKGHTRMCGNTWCRIL